MFTIFSTFTAIAAVVLLLPSNQCEAQDDLRWNLKKDAQFVLELTQTSSGSSSVDSRTSTVESTTKLRFDWLVADVDRQGVATVKQTLKAIAVSVADPQVPSQAIAYDTDSSDKPSKSSRKLLQQVEPLIGISFSVSISPRGEIQKIDLDAETKKKIDQLPDAMKLKALFSRDGLVELLGATNLVIPADDAKQWEQTEQRVTAFGKMDRTHEYSIGLDRTIDDEKLTEIKFTTRVALPKESQVEGVRLTSFQGQGTIWFNRTSGFLSSSKSSNELTTERDYREKVIKTVVTNSIESTLKKK